MINHMWYSYMMLSINHMWYSYMILSTWHSSNHIWLFIYDNVQVITTYEQQHMDTYIWWPHMIYLSYMCVHIWFRHDHIWCFPNHIWHMEQPYMNISNVRIWSYVDPYMIICGHTKRSYMVAHIWSHSYDFRIIYDFRIWFTVYDVCIWLSSIIIYGPYMIIYEHKTQNHIWGFYRIWWSYMNMSVYEFIYDPLFPWDEINQTKPIKPNQPNQPNQFKSNQSNQTKQTKPK